MGVIAAQTGNYEIALQCIATAIQWKGDVASFHNNLGEAYRALCRFSEAEACCRRALELKPDYAEAQNNLGVALKEQGKLAEAVACYRRALELKPNYAEAHGNLGVAFKEQGKVAEMMACYRRALELKPDHAATHNNLGVALKEQGKLAEAVACFGRALELKPGYAMAYSNLGNALKDQGKREEAVACFGLALELDPNYAEAHSNLGIALKENGKLEEAVAAFRRALELKPDSPEVHCNLGVALKEQAKLDDALACWRRALELKPDFTEVYGNMGGAWEEMGDFQAAEDAFRAALQQNPRFPLAHYKLAELLGGKLPEDDLARQCSLLKESDLSDAQRTLLHFGIGRVLDARGADAEAADHFARGNALQMSDGRSRGCRYDPQVYEALTTHIIAACTPDFFQRVRNFGLESELPVFVVGLPRSGTTLIEQILASHSQVFGAGEITLAHETVADLSALARPAAVAATRDPQAGSPCAASGLSEPGTTLPLQAMDEVAGACADLIVGLRRLDRSTARRLAQRHLDGLRALAPTASRIVDKMPENYLFLGVLAALFPRAKFIHCRRDLRDVAVSCWTTHFEEVRWASDPGHIALRFHQYQRVMEHWRRVLPAPLLDVDYEETVADLETAARRLVAWCGLQWEPACLEFHRVNRPAAHGQRRAGPPAALCDFRRPLAALRAISGDVAQRDSQRQATVIYYRDGRAARGQTHFPAFAGTRTRQQLASH